MSSPPPLELPPLRRRLSSFSVASNLNYEVTALNEDGDALSDQGSSSQCEPNRSFILTGIFPMKKPFGASIMDSIPLLPFDYGALMQESLPGKSSKPLPFPIHTMPLTLSSARTHSNYQFIIGVSANSDADTIQQALTPSYRNLSPCRRLTRLMRNSNWSIPTRFNRLENLRNDFELSCIRTVHCIIGVHSLVDADTSNPY